MKDEYSPVSKQWVIIGRGKCYCLSVFIIFVCRLFFGVDDIEVIQTKQAMYTDYVAGNIESRSFKE